MRLLILLFVAGVASSGWAGERLFLKGNGECAFTVPQQWSGTCSISYLMIDNTFKIDVDIGDDQQLSISATMKQEGPELITVYDAQGENKIGVGEKDSQLVMLNFAWPPEGGSRSPTVELSKNFATNDNDLPTIDLSGSITHPLYGAEPYVTFKGLLVIDIKKTSCLFTKEPAACGL